MCLKITIKCLLDWFSLIGGSRHQRGNNQHNCSTTVQLKGRDCTRWTGEKFYASDTWAKRKEPNGHSSGKRRKITTTITCLMQRAPVWCEYLELPTVKPAELKYSRDVSLDYSSQRIYKLPCCRSDRSHETELNQQKLIKRKVWVWLFLFPVRQFTTGFQKSSLL